MIKALRGMKDILDTKESAKFTFFIEQTTKIAERYGFRYIETPKLEETNLFKRSVGESSDIVGKEMYQFVDKGENDVCLRPEGTAGVVRAFIENKLDRIETINRFFYHGSMFRYERPQKGRLREFHQFGCEVFGESSVYEDANLIIMLSQMFKAVGIGFNIELNTLGCQTCVPSYRETLVTFLTAKKEHLCGDCHRRIETNPIRALDCKVDSCQAQFTDAPFITDNVCEVCNSEFKQLQKLLQNADIEFSINKKLVRGLDYYSKTAFEFTSNAIGSQSAIAGGGRYDRLVEFLDGRPTPAIGFAIGIERIFDLIVLPDQDDKRVYLGAMDEESIDILFSLSNELRQKQPIIFEYKKRAFSKHLKQAEKQNASLVLLMGETERSENTIWLKNLITKEEKSIPLSHLIQEI
jgi:histidyl-tRNA synthetase